ncbi:hypothetical protein SAMN05192553_104138 [Cyclobacterium xiamenense]|uniref:Uncharacterized protein n=2 Tax=Cyclobacterium xiamenense TaxID=1297121 RepID=A0A1H6Z0N9_9BACT|nr:hypothetical protein SAMN05192553_104138 [Cyclobacterium xiamenense]
MMVPSLADARNRLMRLKEKGDLFALEGEIDDSELKSFQPTFTFRLSGIGIGEIRL